jgi:PAS domain S-box-containing protein
LKKVLAALFILLISLCLSVTLHAENHSNNRDAISAVVLSGTPPLQFHDRETDSASGFAVDLMDAISKRAGLKVHYNFANTWASLIEKVKSGEADVIASLAISKERQKYLLFTNVIHSSSISIFVRAQNQTIRELDMGLHVGTTRGSIANKSLKQVPDIDMKIYNTYSEGLFSLLAGQIDAFVAGKDIFLKLARDAGVDEKIKIAGNPFINIKRAIAMRRDDSILQSRLNEAIEGFVGSPEYQAIYVKWYGKPTQYWSPRKTVFAMSAFIAVIIFTMTLWRYRSVLRLNEELMDNISERRKVEEELKLFQSLINKSNDAIFVIDPETSRFLSANDKACTNLGYSRDELYDMGVIDIEAVIPDNFSWEKHIEEVREKGFEIIQGIHKRKDGTTYPAEINAIIVDIGARQYMVSVARDVTERLKMEEEIQRSHKLESVGILAGGIAHDFNNLLAAILNNVYISKQNTDRTSKAYSRLVEAEKAVIRASDLTRQLLTFARGGAPVKRTTNIDDVIRESAAFVLRGSNVKCEYDMPDSLWTVEADEGQISQVIQNLVVNADQSMPEGGTIRISGKNTMIGSEEDVPLQAGKYINITVQDQGTGISEENVQNIFNPYFTTREEGHGLGLAVTYSIIKNHDGYISVDSKEGGGTSFTFYLPVSEKQAPPKEPHADTMLTGEGRVLIMDDEEMVRNSLGEMLSGMGYEVELSKDGAEAVAHYEKAMSASSPFDVVILDLTVPGGMGGKEAITKLRELDANIKAIISSGYSNDLVMANFETHGFSDVITKPYSVLQLSRVLKKVLKNPTS